MLNEIFCSANYQYSINKCSEVQKKGMECFKVYHDFRTNKNTLGYDDNNDNCVHIETTTDYFYGFFKHFYSNTGITDEDRHIPIQPGSVLSKYLRWEYKLNECIMNMLLKGVRDDLFISAYVYDVFADCMYGDYLVSSLLTEENEDENNDTESKDDCGAGDCQMENETQDTHPSNFFGYLYHYVYDLIWG